MRVSIYFSANLLFGKLENIQINISDKLRNIWFSKLMSLHKKEGNCNTVAFSFLTGYVHTHISWESCHSSAKV